MPRRLQQCMQQLVFLLAIATAMLSTAQAATSPTSIDQMAQLNVLLLRHGPHPAQHAMSDGPTALQQSVYETYVLSYPDASVASDTQAWPAILRLGIACGFAMNSALKSRCVQTFNGSAQLAAVEAAFKPERMMEATRYKLTPEQLLQAYAQGKKAAQAPAATPTPAPVPSPVPAPTPAPVPAPAAQTSTPAVDSQAPANTATPSTQSAPTDGSNTSAPSANTPTKVIDNNASTTHSEPSTALSINDYLYYAVIVNAVLLVAGIIWLVRHKPKPLLATHEPELITVPALGEPAPLYESHTEHQTAELKSLRRWATELNLAHANIQAFLLRHDILQQDQTLQDDVLTGHLRCLKYYQDAVLAALERAVCTIELCDPPQTWVMDSTPSHNNSWEELGGVLSSCTFIEAWLNVRQLSRTELCHWASMAGQAALGVYRYHQTHLAKRDVLALPAPYIHEPQAPVTVSEINADQAVSLMNQAIMKQVQKRHHTDGSAQTQLFDA